MWQLFSRYNWIKSIKSRLNHYHELNSLCITHQGLNTINWEVGISPKTCQKMGGNHFGKKRREILKRRKQKNMSKIEDNMHIDSLPVFVTKLNINSRVTNIQCEYRSVLSRMFKVKRCFSNNYITGWENCNILLVYPWW